jgi:hypothetical protein
MYVAKYLLALSALTAAVPSANAQCPNGQCGQQSFQRQRSNRKTGSILVSRDRTNSPLHPPTLPRNPSTMPCRSTLPFTLFPRVRKGSGLLRGSALQSALVSAVVRGRSVAPIVVADNQVELHNGP